MQKLYLIGLMIISLSLHGMELITDSVKPQKNYTVKEIDYTVRYKPVGGYLLITPQTRNFYQKIFEDSGIKFDDTVEKVISVQPVQQLHKNKEITLNSKKYIQEHPRFLPLNVFTQGHVYITEETSAASKNVIIQIAAKAHKQEASFYSHEELLHFTVDQNNHNNKQSSKIIAAKEAKKLQEQWDKDLSASTSTVTILSTEEKNQGNHIIEQPRETIHLSKEQINLCGAIKDMYECNGDEKIAYPLEIGKEEESKILFELLDQSLLLNTTGLEQRDISNITSNLNKRIQDLELETLIKVVSVADYYRVVTTYEEKEIKAPSLLTLELIHRMIHISPNERAQYLKLLNNDLQQSILKVFIANYRLTTLLKEYYNTLRDNAPKHIRLNLEDVIENCIAQAFSCNAKKQLHNTCLTLEKALLIYDILQKKETVNSLKITDDNVTTMVRIVFDGCTELQKIITRNKEAKLKEQMRLVEENQQKIRQETIDQELKHQEDIRQEAVRKAAEIKFNSWPEKIKRLIFSRSVAGLLAKTTIGVLLIYLYYHPQALQNYFSSFKNIIF